MCDCHVASPGGPGEKRKELRQGQVGAQSPGRNAVRDTESVLHAPLKLSVDFSRRGATAPASPWSGLHWAQAGRGQPSFPCI